MASFCQEGELDSESVTFMPWETSWPPEISVFAKWGSYFLSHEVSMEIETKYGKLSAPHHSLLSTQGSGQLPVWERR